MTNCPSETPAKHKPQLFGKTKNEILEIITSLGLPKFTAQQLCEWLYKKRCFDFNAMTNLSLKTRQVLSENFSVGRQVHEYPVMESQDGTKKYLFRVASLRHVEAVFIPEKDRGTLCISSQVGCKMNCSFCATGKQGFQQHLSAGEILNQIASLPEFDELSNIVYMGMGEPLDNLSEVLKSIEILTSDWGFAMSPRRITVSTVGISPYLETFLTQCNCHLAVSLHNPIAEERSRIMPIENAFPIEKTMEVLRKYSWQGQRRLSFEYIMFQNSNDTPRHLKGLLRLLNGLPCRVNLIRYHSLPESSWQSSSEDTMISFRDELSHKGIITTIRASRGEDILAACGLLSTQKQNDE